jgi:hypothetical protein
VRRFVLNLVLISTFLLSCGDSPTHPVPYVPVNEVVYLSTPSGYPLQFIGGTVILPDAGVRGIAVHRRMLDLLGQHGVYITGTYYCPHTPDAGCACRKPGTAMFERAARDFDIDLAESLMFGDKESDMVPCVGKCIRVPKDGSWATWYRPRYPSPTPPAKT